MGVLLLLVGVGVLGFGLMQHLKGKRILAAPFKGTGELAKNPSTSDPKGAISTEGNVVAPKEPVLSPCSKQNCLAYEVKIERLWEKTETTQDGTKTVKGSDTLATLSGGAVAMLDDGTGGFAVDFSKGADFDSWKPGFKKELNGRSWAQSIQFGELNYDLPPISSSENWTIGFKATEKYVPVEGKLFVLGKLDGSRIMKPSWRSMLASHKGREGLLGSVQKKKKFSFIGGGVAAALSIPLMIFAPASDPNAPMAKGSYCRHELKGLVDGCTDNVSKSGNEYSWTVEKAGSYTVQVTPPSGKKYPLFPELEVVDASGESLANVESDDMGKAATTGKLALKPGVYTVKVKDYISRDLKGGFDYSMTISGTMDAAPAVAQGSTETISIDAPALAAEFLKDSAAATARFDQHQVEVKGVVADVTPLVDSVEVQLTVPSVPGKFDSVQLSLPIKAQVKKGQTIVARGTAEVDNAAEGASVLVNHAELVMGLKVAAAPAAKAPVKKAGGKVQPRANTKTAH